MNSFILVNLTKYHEQPFLMFSSGNNSLFYSMKIRISLKLNHSNNFSNR